MWLRKTTLLTRMAWWSYILFNLLQFFEMRACATEVWTTPSVTLSKSFRCYGVLCLMKQNLISSFSLCHWIIESHKIWEVPNTHWHDMFCRTCTVFSPRKVWTKDSLDQVSKDATCSPYCSQPQTWHGMKTIPGAPVRLSGARTQYFGLSWVQHLSEDEEPIYA